MMLKQLIVLILTSALITNVFGQIQIGGLFDYNIENSRHAFLYGIQHVNQHILQDEEYKLEPIIKDVPVGNEFQVSQALCNMLQYGVAAVFGPESEATSRHAGNVCDAKEVPYIETHYSYEPSGQLVNLYPSEGTLAQIALDLVQTFEWGSFTIMYETASWLPRLSELLKLYDVKGYTITVRQIDLGITNRNKKNFRAVLRRIKQTEDKSIIIECSAELLTEVLTQAQQVGLLTENHHYIIMSLDAHTIDLEPFQYSGTNFTIMRLVNPLSPLMDGFAEYMKNFEEPEAEPDSKEDKYAMRQFENDNEKDEADIDQNVEEKEAKEEEGASEGFSPDKVSTQAALIFDGILLLAEAFKRMGTEQVQQTSLDCFNPESSWNKGYTVTGFMKTITIQGLTGEIQFDNQGLRSNIAIEIVELGSHGLFQIGLWNTTEGFTVTREAPVIDNSDDGSIKNKTFIVLTALSAPYGMLKDSSVELTGNDRFEGFGIDLIQELSYMLGFKYIFRLQDDGVYGNYNNDTKSWNGMIGELLSLRADLAITDLTITSDRVSAIDFTPSFMNLGIAILYKTPRKEPPSTFSFMSPFSTEVWIYLGTAYMAVSISLFVLGRISPSEWDNPYPCIEEPTHLENQFSFQNSMWFAIGALLQQGSEIAPKATSTRVVASIWWFFTLIMVSSYTANLAAFLVIESVSSPIKSHEDLKYCGVEGHDCPVTFGAKRQGSTINFFKEAEKGTFKNMYQYMVDHPEFLTHDNNEGLERALNENYAYLMESSSIQYIIERNCEVTQIGDLLDDKNYGIGMRKEYKYYSELSEGVLRLQEQGKLAQLQIKWWKEKKGGGACSANKDDGAQAVPLEMGNLAGIFYVLLFGAIISIFFAITDVIITSKTRSKQNQKKESQEADELGMQNMQGIFLVLSFGSIFAVLYGWIEWVLIAYKNSRQEKISFKEELMAEIRFIMACQGNTKEVRHRKSASMDSRNSGASYRSNESLNRDNVVD